MTSFNICPGVQILSVVLIAMQAFAQEPENSAPPALLSLAPPINFAPLFSAPDVPAMGKFEKEAPRRTRKISPSAAAYPCPGRGLSQHPMLVIGEGYNVISVVNDGKVIWKYECGSGGELDDVWMLSNGNILYTRQSYVEEITPTKNVVWHYAAPANTEIHAAQPIGLDRVLIIQNGPTPQLVLANTATNTIESERAIPCPDNLGYGSVHPQFRRGRITAAGTILLPWLSKGRVIEYDQNLKEIWSYATAHPWAAVRLHNGNTMITDNHEKSVFEVSPQGEKVWEMKSSDFPADLPLGGESQTCTRLANGNTVICSTGGGGKGCQMIEVNRDKQVVWALFDWKNLGPVTAVQMLDDPGTPEKPGDLQR